MSGDPDALARVNEQFYSVPLHQRVGFEVVKRGPHAILTMPLTEDVRGPFPGSVHGGMLATLADVACAAALWGAYDSTVSRPVTVDMHIRYYRQPRSGPVTAHAHLVHAGRRILSVECSIADQEERELIRATSTYMLVPHDGG